MAAANIACDKIMQSKCAKLRPQKNKTPAKQSTLSFASGNERKEFETSDLAAVVEKIDMLEGAERQRHLDTVEKRRQRYKKWRK